MFEETRRSRYCTGGSVPNIEGTKHRVRLVRLVREDFQSDKKMSLTSHFVNKPDRQTHIREEGWIRRSRACRLGPRSTDWQAGEAYPSFAIYVKPLLRGSGRGRLL